MSTRLRRILACLALLAFSGAAAAAAVPGHYLVIEVDDAGQVRPVFYRSVQMHDRGIAGNAEFAEAKGNPDRIAASGGKWREVAQVPQFLRGEFAANGIAGLIENHRVHRTTRSFALRIPAYAGSQLQLEFLGRKSVLRVDEIARQAMRLPLATMAQSPAAPLAANSGNRVDILVMGDGYTSAEQSKFNTDAASLRSSMFGTTPYQQYASFVNWTTRFTASNQSGADHPAYNASCTTTSCCSDVAAQSDPRAGMFVDTKFDGTFCTSQIHRLATVNSSKVLAEASAVPDWDEILIVLNDPVYGGSGGQFAVTSTDPNAQLIVIHEYGHTFTRLADEYTSPYPGYPACSDTSGSAPCEPNVTNQTSRNLIKWHDWIAPSTPVPTASGTPGTGLFLGARYQSSGMYRPMDMCAMRNLGVAFCSVCSQEYVLRLYRGGWGSPAQGIDLIEPGTELPNPANIVSYTAGQSLSFSATVLRPSPDTVSLQWYLDGVAIAGATAASYVYHDNAPAPGAHKLELLAFDASALVNANVATSSQNIDIFQHWRTWNIQVQSGGSTPALSIADASISEGNSTSKQLTFTVSLSAAASGPVTYNIATANGTALSGSDYVAKSLSGQSIAAGATSKAFTVAIKGDTVAEPNESFVVNLSNVAGATVADGQATGTIVNDDGGGGGSDTTPPTAPANLVASNGILANVRLSWSASTDSGSGVASYQVFRNGTQVATATGTSFVDKPGSGQWSYVVKAVDGAGNVSPASNTATITK